MDKIITKNLNLFYGEKQILKNIDLNNLTPLDAFDRLRELIEKIKSEE